MSSGSDTKALIEKAIAANPSNAAAYFNLSQAYTQRFDYQAADVVEQVADLAQGAVGCGDKLIGLLRVLDRRTNARNVAVQVFARDESCRIIGAAVDS